METLQAIDQILELFPHYTVKANGEIGLPCPFCGQHGSRNGRFEVKNGYPFYGNDRLIFFPDTSRPPFCRQCGRVWYYDQIVELLAPGRYTIGELLTPADEVQNVPAKSRGVVGNDEDYVNTVHASVRRDYWYENGWTDAIIDRFRLGWGAMYPGSNKAGRHIIPFQARTVEGVEEVWSFEGRLDPEDYGCGEERNIKTAGLTKDYFWHIADGESETLWVAEGPKDAITAYLLGYRHILALFSSGMWTPDIAEWVRQNYEVVIVAGDNDDAGQKMTRHAAGQLYEIEVTSRMLRWDALLPEKYDLTDLLRDRGLEGAKEYLEDNIVDYVPRGFVPRFRDVSPNYVPASKDGPDVYSVQEVRGELPDIICDFLSITRAFANMPAGAF